MKLGDRWQSDFAFRFSVAQMGVTVTGMLFLLLFMTGAAPALRANFSVLFWPLVVVGVVGEIVTYLTTFRLVGALKILYEKRDQPEDLSALTWERLRLASASLPRRLLLLTMVMWPTLSVFIGVWSYWQGALNPEDAFRAGVSGVVYSPIQGLLNYYLARRALLPLGAVLKSAGQEARERLGGFGIRVKLIATFVSLSVIPLITGVFINEVQLERLVVDRNLAQVCSALDTIQAGADRGRSTESLAAGIVASRKKFALPKRVDFLVMAKDGKRMLVGSLAHDLPARRVFREATHRLAPGPECESMLIPGQRRYLVLRSFEDPGLWIGAVTDPFPDPIPFWQKYGAALAMLIVVIGLGVFLGYLTADDVGKSVEELARAARSSARGEFVEVAAFIPDDEMSELATGYNALVASIRRQLERSNQIMTRVREVISGLSGQTGRLQGLAERQREIITQQSALAVQASGGAEQVTRAAEEIQDRARHTHTQMEEASSSCREAADFLETVKKVMAEIANSASEIGRGMEALEFNYRRLEEVVKIIEDVAERTELLSLNAAIEAGGGLGKETRFSVVAGEVQRLSELMSSQTKDIKRIFNEVRKSSLDMAQIIEIGRARAAEGPSRLLQLSAGLEGIEQRAKRAGDSMTEIVGMTAEQAKALEQMKQVVGEIQSVSEMIDSASQETETTAQHLNQLAEQLSGIVVQDEDKKN